MLSNAELGRSNHTFSAKMHQKQIHFYKLSIPKVTKLCKWNLGKSTDESCCSNLHRSLSQ